MLGGIINHCGVFASAGLYGLDFNTPKLAVDHSNARQIAEGKLYNHFLLYLCSYNSLKTCDVNSN